MRLPVVPASLSCGEDGDFCPNTLSLRGSDICPFLVLGPRLGGVQRLSAPTPSRRLPGFIKSRSRVPAAILLSFRERMQIKASFDVVFILKILAVNYIFSRGWMLFKRNSSRS